MIKKTIVFLADHWQDHRLVEKYLEELREYDYLERDSDE